jgi:hypothetical protein
VLGQAGVECGVVLEEIRVADCVASLLKKLAERLGKRGGVLSSEKQNAVIDIDQTSTVVAALGVLSAGDDNVNAVSSVREESAGVTCGRGILLISGWNIDVCQDLTKDLVAQASDLGEV